MALSNTGWLAIAGGIATVVTAAPASAQYHDRNRNESVRERPQPEYDPIGLPVGAFRVYVTAPFGVAYNDNIFATNDTVSVVEEDMLFTFSPRVEARSQWSRHEVVISANLEQEIFEEFEDENRTNFTLAGSGRLDIQRGFAANLSASQGWLEEARTNASAPPNTFKPVDYEVSDLSASLSREFNRLRVSGGASYYEADFDDTFSANGLMVVDQDYRDHESISYNGRVDYAVTPATAFFGNITLNRRDYELQPNDDPADNITISRDSEGFTYSLGANFDVTRLVRGEVSLGYFEEDFLDPSPTIGDVDGLAATARVEWFPTPLATFEFTAQRSVTETGVVGAAGALTTVLGARVDYEVRRNIILTGQISHRNDEYEGIARDDDSLAAAVDVIYLLNQHVGASVSFQHSERDSTVAAVDFDQERLGVNLILRY